MPQPSDPYIPILQALKSGLTEAAATLADTLVRRQPGDARAHALHARVLAAQGHRDAAQFAAERALRLDPGFVPAHIERASLARGTRDWDTALTHLQAVTRLAPAMAEAWLDLGNVLEALQRPADAEQAFGTAARLQPARADAWIKLGRHAYAREAFTEALDHFARAANAAPDAIEAWLNLGETFLRLERLDGALSSYERAAEIAPKDPRGWDGQVRALKAKKAPATAMVIARRGLAEAANTAETYTLLAMQCVRAGTLDAARDAYDQALSLDENYLPARWGRFQYPRSEVFDDDAAREAFLEDWIAGVDDFEKRWPAHADPGMASACVTLATNFYLHYLARPFVAEQRRYGALLERMMAVFDVAAAAPTTPRARDGRRRIGIMSAFVRRHTMMKLFETVITGLDRAEFEISLFHPDNIQGDVSERLRDGADFYASGENTLPWWIDTVCARELDVLLFLDIGMHPIVQGLAALRLAPVQAVLWGHPVTTGLSTIDYFLTADGMEPPGGERNYTEALVRLPRLGTCYRVPDETPQVPEALVVHDPARVNYFFGQSAFKIMPVHDELFARLALALPAARVHMTPHPNVHTRAALRERMTRHFATHGLAFDNVVDTFRFVTEPEFIGIASRAAVNLDSLDWSGGNTTLEILWYDVPTVTLPGAMMRGRHTYAMLKLLELDELIATDIDDYLRIAVGLGKSPDWRADVSGKIRERKHRLYDDRDVIDAIAAFLRLGLRPIQSSR